MCCLAEGAGLLAVPTPPPAYNTAHHMRCALTRRGQAERARRWQCCASLLARQSSYTALRPASWRPRPRCGAALWGALDALLGGIVLWCGTWLHVMTVNNHLLHISHTKGGG